MALNKLLRVLNRAYDEYLQDDPTHGLRPEDAINIIAHSQGTVVTSAALALDPTELNGAFQLRY